METCCPSWARIFAKRNACPFIKIVGMIFFLKLGFWQIDVFTKCCCWNSSKRPKMPQKWIRTILFGSGYTLDTLNRGLGPFFAVFITLFAAGGSVPPWRPSEPPWPWLCHPGPYLVILGHYESYLTYLEWIIQAFTIQAPPPPHTLKVGGIKKLTKC